MKITSDESLRASRVDTISPVQGGAAHTQKPTAGASPAAQVEISAQAQALAASKAEASRFLPAVQNTPDTRDNLVTQLKSQVDAGTYHVSSSDIAEQMVRRAKADSLS